MLTDPYIVLADVYDNLMSEIDYELWAEYIHSIIAPFAQERETVLELAAGCGAFSRYFSRHFPDIILTDLSLPMLQRSKHPVNSMLVCDMRVLPFQAQTISTVICLFDSVNYLMSQKELGEFFNNVHGILKKDGIFVFDSCMFNGSKKHEKMKKRIRNHNGITYTQVSKFNELTGLHRNTFRFTMPDGKEILEVHKQRIYSFSVILRKLMASGFTVLECFQDFTYKEASAKSDRVHFVVRK